LLLKLTYWNFELPNFDKIQLAIERNERPGEGDKYLFLDPISGDVIKKVILPRPGVKSVESEDWTADKDESRMIYLLDCFPDALLTDIKKKKYDKVRCTAIIKIIVLFIVLFLAVFFLAFYSSDVETILAWAFLPCFLLIPITVLAMIFQFNVARAAHKIKFYRDEIFDSFINSYIDNRLIKRERKQGKSS